MSTIPATNGTPVKGAEVVIRCLEKIGVEVIFAYPGGQSIELHQALKNSKLRVVLPRHEQGGAFAADGYARISGKTGCCMATSGPGATNLITGIADAYMDSIPVVFITGQVGASFIGKNAFQETDIIGVTRPLVKHSFLVLKPEDIPSIMFEAFKLASSGRPGPVLVDIPKNIQQAKFVPVYPEWEQVHVPNEEHPAVMASDIEAIRKAISRSKAPCIYAGGGIIASGASEELRQFAHSWNIPVATTLMGLGAFPAEDPLSLRWPGMHGTYCANYAVNECDLLLAFGARFDDRVTGPVKTFAQDAYIVHVDIDFSEINKNKRTDLGIVADIKDVLHELNRNPVRKDYDEWFRQIAQWKQEHPFKYTPSQPDMPPKPQYVLETLYKMTKGEAVIVPGVGQHQMWAAQFYKYKYPRQFLTSGGLGSMGFGLPAAMGAKIACPDKLVVNIDGDGSFQMNIQELGTLVAEDIPVKMILLNNQYLGMVAQWEDRFYGSNHCNTVLKSRLDGKSYYPDFVMIANGYGVPGRTVRTSAEVEDAICEMLETDGPFLLDCHTGYEEHVLPMIPPGCSYKDILTE
ncbi:MAG: biosynthetic-type acetolactate synthase large subunit [Lentisphaeria bacterium]|nr:biosynthetic-type acetolactate synthase large subunit [Lentisphaeria bacterium]